MTTPAPGHDRNVSLGWLALAWMEFFVRHGPGDVQGEPVEHGDEYSLLVVDGYALDPDDPHNAHMRYDSLFFSRPKGCDKSGLGARLALFEALGPARFSGQWAKGGEVYRDPWGMGFKYVYAPGEPMGKPVTAPFIRCMATEETQVGNVYATIYYNLTDYDCPLSHVPGVDAGMEKVILPTGGEIRVSTASSSSKDGGKETFVVFDESHLYNTPDLRRMYTTVTRNLRKRKKAHTGAGTWYIETTTMFAPGEESVAELTFKEAEALTEGRKRRGRWRLFYDHRWGVCDDTTDEAALRAALADAYGEAALWVSIDGLVDEWYDVRNAESDSRRYFLNAQTSTKDSWLRIEEWDACGSADGPIKPKTPITLGLDGSIRDDATALVACTLDGTIQLLDVWEQPEGAEGEDWEVDREAVDAAVYKAMKTYKVVGFFVDPPHFQDSIAVWQREFGDQMTVRASQKRPFSWWTNRPTAMVEALRRFRDAVMEKRIRFVPAHKLPEGSEARRLASVLKRHATNARQRPSRSGMQIGKEFPKSSKKIDGLVAAVLAYEASQEAIATDKKPKRTDGYVPKRLR